MKNYLRNYLTPSEQRVLMIILAIAFISLLAISYPVNTLYSDEVTADSIRTDIEIPYHLILDVRFATKDELTQIKGIGPQTADKIITFRDSVEIQSNYDLLRIKGIGEKGLAKWLPFLKEMPKDSLRIQTPKETKETSKIVANKQDFNKASAEDLMKVKGIGEKKAAQIIAFRRDKNGLTEMQELLSIKGIGKKTLAKIEELFYIGKN